MQTTATIDTGSSCSHIAAHVLASLGLEAVGKRPCYNLRGDLEEFFGLFHVNLFLPSANGESCVVVEELPVLDFSVPQFGAILGRDVLETGRFLYDGIRQRWLLQILKTREELALEAGERVPELEAVATCIE